MTYLPWHQAAADTMHAVIRQGQLTHAWLMHGTRGTGRGQFALALAQYLLCEQPEPTGACGQCPSCHWFSAETHPDSLLISPESEGKAIRVDQIRDLIEKLSLTPHGKQGRRVVIISPAEALNRQAANSLLKSLEEPPPNTYFFLITAELSALPATIRSRCQLLKLPSASAEQAKAWLEQVSGGNADTQMALEIADNAPLVAGELLESGAVSTYQQFFREFIQAVSEPVPANQMAEQWLKQAEYMPINWMLRWLSVLIKLKQANTATDSSLFKEQDVKSLLQLLTLEQLFRFYDDVLEANRLWSAPLNRRLQLESLFSKWLALFQ